MSVYWVWLQDSSEREQEAHWARRTRGHCLVAKWVESVRHASISFARQVKVLSTQWVKLELRRQSKFGKHSKGKWDGGGSEVNC